MNRRLMHYVVDGYRTDARDHRTCSTAPSCGSCRWRTRTATTTPSSRASGCGARTCATTTGTGITPATASTSTATSRPSGATTTRAPRPTRQRHLPRPAPASEPETRALEACSRRVGFEFLVNYHSAAELLLYGTGWQVATPGPDDVIYEAMAGDDANPRSPATTRTSPRSSTRPTVTPTRLRTASARSGSRPRCRLARSARRRPGRRVEPSDCGTGFEFPDDEELVQAEFGKNIPFAMSVAESADRPGRPGLRGRSRGRRLRGRQLRRLLRRPAGGRVVAKRALSKVQLRLPHQRRPRPRQFRPRSGGAVSATATRTTTTTPSTAAW